MMLGDVTAHPAATGPEEPRRPAEVTSTLLR
jgi:hypothetical protein